MWSLDKLQCRLSSEGSDDAVETVGRWRKGVAHFSVKDSQVTKGKRVNSGS